MNLIFSEEYGFNAEILQTGYIAINQHNSDEKKWNRVVISPHQALRLSDYLKDMASLSLSQRWKEVQFLDTTLAKKKVKNES